MCRLLAMVGCGFVLFCGCLALPVAYANGPHFPPVETPIDQAVARVSGNTLTAVRVVMEHVYETRQETYPVTVKVARTVNDPATQQPKVVYEDQTETRTRNVAVTRPVYKQVMLRYDIDNVHTADLSGAKIDAATLKIRLAKQGLVLTSLMGPAVPEKFTLLFKPETIVLDLSRSMPMAPPPPLAPAPPTGPGDVIAAPLPIEIELPRNADIPPQFRLASIDADGQFSLKAVATQAMTSTRYVTRQQSRVVDGRESTVTVCVPISVTERRESSHTVNYPATAVSGITVDERPLDDRHRVGLKSREIPVVVGANGKGVEAFWLQNIKPNMLVLTVPSFQGPLPPGQMAPPLASETIISPTTPMPVPVPLPPAPMPRE
jgi:hypothetical protein